MWGGVVAGQPSHLLRKSLERQVDAQGARVLAKERTNLLQPATVEDGLDFERGPHGFQPEGLSARAEESRWAE